MAPIATAPETAFDGAAPLFKHILHHITDERAFGNQSNQQPNQQRYRYHNGPNQALRLMLQVHKLAHDEESLHDGENDENAVTKSTWMHQEHKHELDSRDTYQNTENTPNPGGVWLGNFAHRGVFSCYLSRHGFFIILRQAKDLITLALSRVNKPEEHSRDKMLRASADKLNEVEKGEYEYPHQVYKVPIEADFFNHFVMTALLECAVGGGNKAPNQ